MDKLMHALPALPVVLPLLGAALLAALRKALPRSAQDSISIAFGLANLVVCSLLLSQALRQTVVYWFGNWYPRGPIVLGIGFVVDPVSAGLATLAALLTTLALLFSWRFVDAGDNHLHPLLLVFLAGMSGFSLTGDIFNLFVFFELMSTAAFALCGLNQREPAPLQGAFNFAVTNTIAAFLSLTGIALLYAVTGALNMAQIGLQIASRHDPLVLFAFTLLLCGFLTKAAVVPFHFWLADAHAVSPTPVCVLFSGLMVELGLYAVLRLHAVIFQGSFTAHAGHLRLILLSLGTLTALFGGVMCYAEHHLKRLLAFSTISHSGLMLLALSLMTPASIAGFLLYLLAHAFVKSALFFVAGILLHRLRSMSEPKLFRKGRALPFTAVLWFLGALGLAGVPVFATMRAEALTATAAEALHAQWISWIFLLAGALTAAAVLRVGMHTFLGLGSCPLTDRSAQVDELPETPDGNQRTPWYLFTPPALCIVAAILLTFAPAVHRGVLESATRLLAQPTYITTVFKGSAASPDLPDVHPDLLPAALRGSAAGLLALALAASSVFRQRLPRALRIGAFLEGPLLPLRELHSGHPGDYVLWLTVGTATLGFSILIFTR
ncbi:MAG: hypothetical protein NVSMB3_05380 [Acidobacteriaceae bacterium]